MQPFLSSLWSEVWRGSSGILLFTLILTTCRLLLNMVQHTDMLFWITMAVTVVAFVIISIIMFVFIYQYQYREGQKAKYFPDNHYLELAWTIIPAIVLGGINLYRASCLE